MARHFNGIDQCLQGPVTTYKPTPEWTVSVHGAMTSDLTGIIVGGRGQNTAVGWGLHRSAGGAVTLLNYGIGGSGHAASDAGVFPADGQWHAVVVRITGAVAYLYVDGVACGSGPWWLAAAVPYFPWMIGAWYDGHSDDRPEFHWNGSIAEVALWHHDIGDAAAKALAHYTPLAIGDMEYYWPLGGFAGKNDREWKGRMAELTPVSSPTWVDHPSTLLDPTAVATPILLPVSSTEAISTPRWSTTGQVFSTGADVLDTSSTRTPIEQHSNLLQRAGAIHG